MIRTFNDHDLSAVMQIWLNTNIKAHSFIPEEYWIENYHAVKEMMPQAELYIYESDDIHQIVGFIGLMNNYIAGIFIKEGFQSKGIGKQLLHYVMKIKNELILSVYQKNSRAVSFYQREGFTIQSEGVDGDTNENEFTMNWSR